MLLLVKSEDRQRTSHKFEANNAQGVAKNGTDRPNRLLMKGTRRRERRRRRRYEVRIRLSIWTNIYRSFCARKLPICRVRSRLHTKDERRSEIKVKVMTNGVRPTVRLPDCPNVPQCSPIPSLERDIRLLFALLRQFLLCVCV